MNEPDSDGSLRPEAELNPTGEFVLSFLARLGSRKYGIISIIFIASTIAVVISLILPKKYDAVATILPGDESSRRLSLGQELSQLSPIPLNFSGGLTQQRSVLYPDILKSRKINKAILSTEYRFEFKDKDIRTNLYDWWKLETDDDGYKMLAKVVSINHSPLTGIVTISARTVSPQLSADIVNRYLAELDIYNNHVRISRAKETLTFTENRLNEVKEELVEAELDINSFQEKNRNYFNSTDPDLNLQLGRLTRQVELKNQLFITLSNQYEIARIEAKKDIPIIQILDYGVPPSKKSSPNRKLIVLAIFFVSTLLVFLCLVIVELYNTLPTHIRQRLRVVAVLFRPGSSAAKR
ncbi:Wzz/FepE/Etk N-terminal domain-containing protein [candidate division KSB1 bacterium]